MSDEEEQILNFNKVCRLCLVEKRCMSFIFKSKEKGSDETPLHEKIMSCASVVMYDGDGLPPQICSKCLSAVNQSYSLRGQVEESNARLQQMLQQMNQPTEKAKTCSSADIKVKVETTALDYLQLDVSLPDDLTVKDGKESEDWDDDESKPLSMLSVAGQAVIQENLESEKLKPVEEKTVKKKAVRQKKPTFVDCTLCGKAVQRRKFKLHMMVHNGEKPHLCDTCGKSFTWKFALVTHKRVHSGEKPYLCKQCGQSFRSSSRYAEHSTIHTGRRSYVCERCALAFRTSGRLKRHLRIHTGEKPYKCSFCDRGFSESYNLKQHLRLHTGEKPPHVCPMCKHAFIRRKMLVDHLRVHHGVTTPMPPVININISFDEGTVHKAFLKDDLKITE